MVTRRRYSRDIHRTKIAQREDLEAAVYANLTSIIKSHDPTVAASGVRIAAKLSAIIASQIAVHPQTAQKALKAIEDDISEYATTFVGELVNIATKSVGEEVKRFRAAPPPVRQKSMMELADDWAGPVAGPTVIERHYGIPRSTLYRWQKANEAVAIDSRTSRKPLFPLLQFVDGRPADGISKMISIFGSQRDAWKWLVTPHPKFDGERPLDRLLAGEVEHASAVASDDAQP